LKTLDLQRFLHEIAMKGELKTDRPEREYAPDSTVDDAGLINAACLKSQEMRTRLLHV
jgi:hypothetical protein